jgi:hypothetical protein
MFHAIAQNSTALAPPLALTSSCSFHDYSSNDQNYTDETDLLAKSLQAIGRIAPIRLELVQAMCKLAMR